MVKMIIRFARWLETRFPEKMVVTPQEYQTLLQRVLFLETNSTHKDATKAVVLKMKDLQDEFATIKTGLGLNNPKNMELMAMLNGQPISQEENI